MSNSENRKNIGDFESEASSSIYSKSRNDFSSSQMDMTDEKLGKGKKSRKEEEDEESYLTEEEIREKSLHSVSKLRAKILEIEKQIDKEFSESMRSLKGNKEANDFERNSGKAERINKAPVKVEDLREAPRISKEEMMRNEGLREEFKSSQGRIGTIDSRNEERSRKGLFNEAQKLGKVQGNVSEIGSNTKENLSQFESRNTGFDIQNSQDFKSDSLHLSSRRREPEHIEDQIQKEMRLDGGNSSSEANGNSKRLQEDEKKTKRNEKAATNEMDDDPQKLIREPLDDNEEEISEVDIDEDLQKDLDSVNIHGLSVKELQKIHKELEIL